MLFAEPEIGHALSRVKAAFPRFGNWEHNNEANEYHSGFALWGEFVPCPDEPMPRRFYVTFDAYGSAWVGHLSVGQPSYYWSSADFGDAHLVDTDDCATLDEAISTLKKEIAALFSALTGS